MKAAFRGAARISGDGVDSIGCRVDGFRVKRTMVSLVWAL